MTRTDYIRWPTGATLYAKPLPLTDSAWGDDDIAGVENAALGSYAFAALAETTEYEVFVQAGGSPASSDLAIGVLVPDAETAMGQMLSYHQTTDTLIGLVGVSVVNSIQAIIGTPANATIAQDIADTKAVVDSIETEMADSGEPAQGAPPETATLAEKVSWLYKAWRNKKTQTATQISVFADDGTTVDHKATISDDGTTATIGEMESGP